MEYLTLASGELGTAWTAQVRALLWDAFDDFTEDDWQHGLGGLHVLAVDGSEVIGHASVVPRAVYLDERSVHAGYVEGVAVAAARRRVGVGAAVMRQIGDIITATYPLGVLSTSEHPFYERAGWQRWQGPTLVREGGRLHRTRDEDDGIMVLPVGGALDLDLSSAIAVDARSGDDW